MKVKDCTSCEHCSRRVWTQYYKPIGYHAIGMNHAYAYCEKHGKRVSEVKRCDDKIVLGGKHE